MLRERLAMVTHAWFAQREFTDVEILRRFQESLAEEEARGALEMSRDDQYLGMSLRELIHEFKWQTLVLLKCCLLQPKMLFFGSRCDRLCMVQFSLVSLIPGLIRNLQDSAGPELNSYCESLTQSTSLQSSNRASLLQYMGLPLQIFGKGSIFGPYTPLQQLDMLADFGTKSYIVGSTNSLLLQQKDKYSDIIINLDEDSISISSPSLRSVLALTAADRRWIDFLTLEINETWDDANPNRPKTMQYAGSEEFIRSQFEAYILGLLSSVKFHNFLAASQGDAGDEDPLVDYGVEWVEAWKKTENYRVWNDNTDANLFAVSEPKHPCAGGLTMDDVQRRIAEQVKDLHIDERLAQGREMLGRNFAAGKEKASSMFNKLYSDVESMREAQRKRIADGKAATPNPEGSEAASPAPIDLAKAQQTMQNVGNKAGAYVSSWASWAGEKRKTTNWSWRNSAGNKTPSSGGSPSVEPVDKDYQIVNLPSSDAGSSVGGKRLTQASFGESILGSSPDRPVTASSVGDDKPLEGLGITTTTLGSPTANKKKDDGFQTENVMGSKEKLDKIEDTVVENKKLHVETKELEEVAPKKADDKDSLETEAAKEEEKAPVEVGERENAEVMRA